MSGWIVTLEHLRAAFPDAPERVLKAALDQYGGMELSPSYRDGLLRAAVARLIKEASNNGSG